MQKIVKPGFCKMSDFMTKSPDYTIKIALELKVPTMYKVWQSFTIKVSFDKKTKFQFEKFVIIGQNCSFTIKSLNL